MKFIERFTLKIGSQEGGFLNFLRPLMSACLPLMKNVLIPLAKSVLIALGLRAATSATDGAIQTKSFGSGHSLDLEPRTTALIISNEEMNDIIKIVKPLEELSLLKKRYW